MGEGRDPERGGQGTETSERGRLTGLEAVCYPCWALEGCFYDPHKQLNQFLLHPLVLWKLNKTTQALGQGEFLALPPEGLGSARQ